MKNVYRRGGDTKLEKTHGDGEGEGGREWGREDSEILDENREWRRSHNSRRDETSTKNGEPNASRSLKRAGGSLPRGKRKETKKKDEQRETCKKP
jgi:hypothetical protein